VLLTLERLTLRDWRDDDAEVLAPLADNHAVWVNLRDRFPHPYTLDDARAFVARNLGRDPPHNVAICLADSPIGSIGIIPGADIHRVSAEVGYWLGEPFWGQGYATEAIRGFTPWAFAAFDVTRLFASVFTYNPASGRALEKAGYVREATCRQAAIKEGRIHDEWLYACVRRRSV
jgi:RimJ/RimL family protein N-acetyltransferase